MPPQRWSPTQLNVLLSDIESSKGRESLYLRDPDEAYRNVIHQLRNTQPLRSFTKKQIVDKIKYIATHNTVGSNSRRAPTISRLFTNGVSVLQPGIYQPVAQQVGDTGPAVSDNDGTNAGSHRRVISVCIIHRNTVSPGHGSQLQTRTQEPGSSSLQASQSNAVQPTLGHEDIGAAPGRNAPAGSQNANNPELVAQVQYGYDIRKIERYLTYNPVRFVPNDKDLRQLTHKLMDQILYSVRCVLNRAIRSQDIDHSLDNDSRYYEDSYNQPPRLNTPMCSQPFLEVCRTIFGGRIKNDVLRNATQLSLQMDEFLYSFIGASICEWVWKGRHTPLPAGLDKSDTGVAFEDEIRELSPDIHMQALYRSNASFVETGIQYRNFAPELSYRLWDNLSLFLRENELEMIGDSSGIYLDSMNETFTQALCLRADIMLKEQAYTKTLLWPSPGTVFDPRTMTQKPGAHNADRDTEGRVKLTILPGFMGRKKGELTDSEMREETIFPATVILA